MITLKKFKPVPAMSQETLAFTAEIHLGNRKIGTARNNGTGGGNELWIMPEYRDEFNAAARVMVSDSDRGRDEVPNNPRGGSVDGLADEAVGRLVDEAVAAWEEAADERWIKAQVRKMAKSGIPVAVVLSEGDEMKVIGVRDDSEATLERVAKEYQCPREKLRVVKTAPPEPKNTPSPTKRAR